MIDRFGGSMRRQGQDLIRVDFGGSQECTCCVSYQCMGLRGVYVWWCFAWLPAWLAGWVSHIYIHFPKIVELRFTKDGNVHTRVGRDCWDMRRINLLGCVWVT